MYQFAEFAFEAGGALAAAAVIAAWTFRSASAPTWAKIALPTAMMALVIAAPWKVNALLGLPRHATLAELPKSFDLLSFVANDDTGRVYLWLRTGGEPVAYDVPLSKSMRDALRAAQTDMVRQGSVRVGIDSGVGHDKEEGESLFTIDKSDRPKRTDE
jgi:hypothetical protein